MDVDKLKAMVHVKDEDIARARRSSSAEREPADENPQGTVVRLLADGADRRRRRSCMLVSVPNASSSGHLGLLMLVAGRGGDHAGLSHRVHADGHGHDLHLARLRP